MKRDFTTEENRMSSFVAILTALSLFIGIIATLVSLFIAFRSLSVSQQSLKLSSESLKETQRSNEIANRPYVGCINFVTHDEHFVPVDKVRGVAFYCLNRPARITRQHIRIATSDVSRKPAFDDDDKAKYVIYPFGLTENPPRTYFVPTDIKKIVAELRPSERLFRIVEVEYETLDGDKQFRFETTWVYDLHEQIWRETNTNAN